MSDPGPDAGRSAGDPSGLDRHDWRGVVVIAAANNWDQIRFQDRHVAERIRRYAPVLYVDPPLSPIAARRIPELADSLAQPRLRLAAEPATGPDGEVVGHPIARLTPVVGPFPQRRGMSVVTTALVRRAIRRAVGVLGGTVAANICSSPLVPTLGPDPTPGPFRVPAVAGFGGEIGGLQVFWAQDDLVAGAELLGQDAERLRRGEQVLRAAADVIVAANPSVAQHWRDQGEAPHLIPFGVDAAIYEGTDAAPLPDDVDLPGPIAGFVGHLAERIDVRLLEAVADRGISLLLVGPRHPRFEIGRMDALLARPNVAWVGTKAFEDLPSYQRVIDVGLVPYTRSGFNIGSFPLKTMEYLAAGRTVVATDLPATRWLDAGDRIGIADEPEAFADLVEEHLARPRTAADVADRRAFAARHSWEERALALARVLGLPGTGPESTGPPTDEPATTGALR